ncbi:MAG: hypothetical protein IID42_13450 [Planctomycetes bacterium]|nr:hypothetical protein [Planctomycetota bacterium]
MGSDLCPHLEREELGRQPRKSCLRSAGDREGMAALRLAMAPDQGMAALRLAMAPDQDMAALRFPMCIGMAPDEDMAAPAFGGLGHGTRHSSVVAIGSQGARRSALQKKRRHRTA